MALSSSFRQLTVLKTDVQHRADNLNHYNVLFAHDGFIFLLPDALFFRASHYLVISGMAPWRARFISASDR